MDYKKVYFRTSDGLRIGARLLTQANQSNPSCIIIAPGFASHSGLKSIQEIMELLSPEYDVICVDFRGNGLSEGRYSFGRDEFLDLLSIIDSCSSQYENIHLLGFSLGAYNVMRAVINCKSIARISQLFLVSIPTRVEDVIRSGAVVRQTIDQVFVKRNFKKERALFFKWGNPFSQKPSAADLAVHVKVPASFLVASNDLLVPKELSMQVYNQVPGNQKNWKELGYSLHADEIFRVDPKTCIDWIISNRH